MPRSLSSRVNCKGRARTPLAVLSRTASMTSYDSRRWWSLLGVHVELIYIVSFRLLRAPPDSGLSQGQLFLLVGSDGFTADRCFLVVVMVGDSELVCLNLNMIADHEPGRDDSEPCKTARMSSNLWSDARIHR